MTRTVDEALSRFELIAGVGSEESGQACAMTLLAWVAGREWTDALECAHPVIQRAVVKVNDANGTTPEMRAEIVRAGVDGILDTWWVPTAVVVRAFALDDEGEISPCERLLRALSRVAEWKKSGKGLPPSLTRADLTRADLTDADLTGACLRDACLRGAYLTGAVLTGAQGIPVGGMPVGWKLNDGGLWVRDER